jgi:hypothetical protein
MKRAALGVRMHSGWGVVVGVCADGDLVEVVERRRIVVVDPKMPGTQQPYHYAKLLLSQPLPTLRQAQGRLSRAKGARDMGPPTSPELNSRDPQSARELLEPGTTGAEARDTPEALRSPFDKLRAGSKGPLFHIYPALKETLAGAEKYLADCAGVSERLALAAVGDVVRELEGRGYRVVGCAVLLGAGRPLPGLEKILAAHPLIHTAEGEFFRNAVRKACEGLRISVTGIPERELGERALAAFGNAAAEVERRIARMGKSIGPPWTQDHKTAALAALMVLGTRSRI